MRIQSPESGARLASTSGHVMRLQPNEVRELEGDMLRLALEAGCFAVGAAPAPPVVEPVKTREALIEEAIRELMERGDETAFTTNGQPRVREVAVILGDEVTKGEVESVFAAMSV